MTGPTKLMVCLKMTVGTCQDASSFKFSIDYLITDKGHEKTTPDFLIPLY